MGGGTEDDGTASGGAPTGGFLRGLEMGLSLGPPPSQRSRLHGSGVVAAAAAAAAESAARAASEAVVSLLGQAGGGGGRRVVVLTEAVDALVAAFGLKPAVVSDERGGGGGRGVVFAVFFF